MISSLLNMNMPELFFAEEMPEDEKKPADWTLAGLEYWDISIKSFHSIGEVLRILDLNPKIPGVLVLEGQHLIGLIPRERIYEKIGRPYGVELFLKENAKQFYEILACETLVLPSRASVEEALKAALARREEALYDPIVVSHPDGYRFISMFTLLRAQQNILRDLNSEIHRLSTKDPLTLVNNRRGFFETVAPKLEAARQLDLEHAALMVDIDNFKQVNDRYGHQVGDEVIKSVAQKISGLIRAEDALGRFGGEEFVIFLPNISSDGAFTLAEQLRQEIAGYFHTVNWFQIRVTVSIGMSHSKGASRTFDRLLTEADQAVYAAKNRGRNKVIVWDEHLNQAPPLHTTFRIEKSEPLAQSVAVQTLQGLLRMLYLRDHETEAHTQRVADLTLTLAKKTGIPEHDWEGIHIGALLHDIGKIAIPDKILLKQGKLTKAEQAIIQKHPQHAYDLLAPISYFQHALDIPYCHHEYWNGQGYPRGLRGEEIPLAARIFTIVDVWDALSSDRPYRPAWKEQDTKDYIRQQAGALFDPVLAARFLEMLEQ